MTNPPKLTHKKSQTKKNRVKSHDGIIANLSTAQKIILIVIYVAFLAVAIFTIFALNFNQKYQVEARISDLATAYYENYYYPRAFNDDYGNIDSAKAANFLSQFTDTGLAPVSLRQILLSTPGISNNDQKLLLRYCDENRTTITYKPETPYAHDSYHIDYHYSCNFD